MNMKYVGILFGACLVVANGGCVVESTGPGVGGTSGSSGASGSSGSSGASGSSGTAGSAGTTGGTAGTGGTTGSGGSGGTGGTAECAHCGVFVTDGGQLCADDPTAMTSDTTDFIAIVDCMCAAGEGCETECKATCPVGDGTPDDACIKCVSDFTKDMNGTCKMVQDTCANDI